MFPIPKNNSNVEDTLVQAALNEFGEENCVQCSIPAEEYLDRLNVARRPGVALPADDITYLQVSLDAETGLAALKSRENTPLYACLLIARLLLHQMGEENSLELLGLSVLTPVLQLPSVEGMNLILAHKFGDEAVLLEPRSKISTECELIEMLAQRRRPVIVSDLEVDHLIDTRRMKQYTAALHDFYHAYRTSCNTRETTANAILEHGALMKVALEVRLMEESAFRKALGGISEAWNVHRTSKFGLWLALSSMTGTQSSLREHLAVLGDEIEMIAALVLDHEFPVQSSTVTRTEMRLGSARVDDLSSDDPDAPHTLYLHHLAYALSNYLLNDKIETPCEAYRKARASS